MLSVFHHFKEAMFIEYYVSSYPSLSGLYYHLVKDCQSDNGGAVHAA